MHRNDDSVQWTLLDFTVVTVRRKAYNVRFDKNCLQSRLTQKTIQFSLTHINERTITKTNGDESDNPL